MRIRDEEDGGGPVDPGPGGGSPSLLKPQYLKFTWTHTDANNYALKGFRIAVFEGSDPNDTSKYLTKARELGPLERSTVVVLTINATITINAAIQTIYADGNESSWRLISGTVARDPDTLPLGTAASVAAAQAAATTALTPSAVSDGVTAQFLVGVPAKRTNLLPYSQDFGNAAWAKTGATITTDAAAAPDGTLTADKIAETAVTSGHYAAQTVTLPAGAFTISAYMKAAERTMGWIQLGSTYVAVDLSTGTLAAVVGGGTASIMDAGGGIWRVGLTATVTAGGKLCLVGAATGTTAAPVYSYAGAAGSGIYAWGAQLNSGSVADAYLATLADPVSDFGITCEDWRGVWELGPAPRTNIFIRSQEFENSAWVKARATITANATTAPDGTLTAEKLTEDTTASNTHYTRQDRTLVSGTTYTGSVYLKAGERSRNTLHIFGLANSEAFFDLASGTLIGKGTAVISAAITPAGNGWYRCSATWLYGGTGTGMGVQLLQPGTTNNSYTGDGVSGLYIWGAQIETGTAPTPYIPTTTAAVTVTDITVANGLATLSPAPLQGAILRGVSSNASQQASLAAPAIVADHAAITLPNATYPAGRIVYQTAGTPAGTLWQVNAAGTAWQTPALGVASLVGQLVAGQIAAGAITAEHLQATMALLGAIQSRGTSTDGLSGPGAWEAGTSSLPPKGFKLSGPPFTTYFLDGTSSPSCQFELGGDINLNGYRLSGLGIAKLKDSGLVEFSTPGTFSWVVPPGITSVVATLVGGGGGGAGSLYPDYTIGGGGGGGGSVRARIAVTPGATVTVVVGAAGTAGSIGAGGGNGGDSQFGTLIAKGGLGADGSGRGGAGGASVSGLTDGGVGGSSTGAGGSTTTRTSFTWLLQCGGAGGGATSNAGGSSDGGNFSGGTGSGSGGASAYGPGANGVSAGSNGASPTSGFGGGGSGGYYNGTGRTGGAGRPGKVTIEM